MGGHTQIPGEDAEGIFIVRMASGYARAGHHVKVFVKSDGKRINDQKRFFRDTFGFADHFQICKIRIPDFWLFSYISLFFIFPLEVALFNPKLVHSRNLSVALICCKIFRLDTVLEFHGYPLENRWMKWMFERLRRSSKFKGVIGISSGVRDDFKAKFGNALPIFIFPDAIDEMDINYSLDGPFSFRKALSLNVTSSDFLVVYTGQLYKGRGIDFIIKLADLLPKILFYIVGGRIKDIDKYRSLSKNSNNVFFTGAVSPKDALIYQKAADVLLMPYEAKVAISSGKDSSRYASPLKLFEYLASGRPIIASDLPILKDILIHGKNCMILPLDDIQLWKVEIERLILDMQYRVRNAKSQIELVSAFTWATRAKNIIAFSSL